MMVFQGLFSPLNIESGGEKQAGSSLQSSPSHPIYPEVMEDPLRDQGPTGTCTQLCECTGLPSQALQPAGDQGYGTAALT